MEDVCRRCHSTIMDCAAMVIVKVSKEHTYCANCWNGIEPKWHHRLRHSFPLQNLRMLTSAYVFYGLPLRHYNPLPVERADASMA